MKVGHGGKTIAQWGEELEEQHGADLDAVLKRFPDLGNDMPTDAASASPRKVYDLSKTIIDSETGEIISQGDQGPEADALRSEHEAMQREMWEERKARNRATKSHNEEAPASLPKEQH